MVFSYSSLNLLNSCLSHVGNDRFCSVFSSGLGHQFLDYAHSSSSSTAFSGTPLILRSIVNSFPSAIYLPLLDSLPCSTCQASLSTIFRVGRGVETQRYKFFLLESIPLFQCNRLALNRKRSWRETLSAKMSILFLCL